VLVGAVTVAIALTLLTGLGGWVGAHSTHGWNAGLWQRLSLMVAHVWVFICATALIVEASRGWRQSDGV
jgi:hypothetical protein